MSKFPGWGVSKHRRILLFLKIAPMMPPRWWCSWWCWNDGTLHWRKGERIKQKWHSECCRRTLLQSHRHGRVQIPLLCISPQSEKKNLAFFFFLSNHFSEYPLSYLPCPPEVAKDRCDIKYSNRVIPGEIYHGKFHRRSYLDIHRLFCVVSGFKDAPVWDVTERQSLQIAELWRNEAMGRTG